MPRNYLKLLLFIGVFYIGNSCSEKETYEVIDSTDVLPQAQGDYNYEEKEQETEEIVYSKIEIKLLNLLPNISFKEENTLAKNQASLLPNRLGYNHKQEVYFNLDSTDYYLIEWTFSDSSRTVNAFYNWLDCFGPNCRSIKVNEEKNLIRDAFAIWVSHHKINYLTSNKSFKTTHWEKLLFEDKQIEDFYFLLTQNVRSRTNWLYNTKKE